MGMGNEQASMYVQRSAVPVHAQQHKETHPGSRKWHIPLRLRPIRYAPTTGFRPGCPAPIEYATVAGPFSNRRVGARVGPDPNTVSKRRTM